MVGIGICLGYFERIVERRYLEVYVQSFLSFISAVNSSSEGRDVVPSVGFSSDIEVIFRIIRMRFEESLPFFRNIGKLQQFLFWHEIR